MSVPSVNAEQVVWSETKYLTAIVDASDIQMRDWSRRIDTTLGNKQPFFASKSKRNAEGEMEAVLYKQRFGCMHLIVWND